MYPNLSNYLKLETEVQEVFKYCLALLCFGLIHQVTAQQKPENIDFNKIQVQGYFIEDSLQLGLSFFYTLSVQYPAEVQILFPDQKYDYGTFDLLKRHYFDTKTQNKISRDSVLYEFRTFEIDEIHTLSLPIFVIPREDTLSYPIQAKLDSIKLKELVTTNKVNHQLRPQTGYQKVQNYFNYPFFIGVVLFILIIFLVIWGLLGARFKKYYALFQYKNKQLKFIKEFSKLSARILREKSINSIEQAITLWKKHMEFIENKPFSTYTSKEISQLLPDENLEKSLKNIDRAIYGKDFSKEIESSLTILQHFSETRFEKKYIRLKNV